MIMVYNIILWFVLIFLTHAEKINFISQEFSNWNQESIINIYEQFSIPDNNIWSHCQYCNIRDGKIQIYHSNMTDSFEQVILSRSLWEEFFHHFQNDKLEGRIIPFHSIANNTITLIKNPLFIIPMITFHPGHLLVDVLEQIFTEMMETYGNIVKDSIIAIDVANNPEQIILDSKLSIETNISNGFPAYLLKAFSSNKIISFQSLLKYEFDLRKTVLFENIHIGTNTRSSYYYMGFKYHPYFIPRDYYQSSTNNLATNYQIFARFMNQFVEEKYSIQDNLKYQQIPSNIPSILIIQRKENRKIKGIDGLLHELTKINARVVLSDFSANNFKEQVMLLATTDVLIATAGTALHNMIFLKPKSHVIFLMQPLWCSWAWIYVNQAILLDLFVHVYCSDSENSEKNLLVHDHLNNIYSNSKYISWHRKALSQGPRLTKAIDVTIDPIEVRDMILLSLLTPSESDPSDTYHHYHLKNEWKKSNNDSIYIDSIRLIVSEVFLKQINPQVYTLELFQELVGDHDTLKNLLHYNIQLSLCIETLFRPERASLCASIEDFNYYSKLSLGMPANETLVLHQWVQLTPTGGKLVNSDNVMVFDSRLSDGGINLSMNFYDELLLIPFLFYLDCLSTEKHYFEEQISLTSSQLDQKDCRLTFSLVFTCHIHNQFSFQHCIYYFCSEQSWENEICGSLALFLHKSLYQSTLLRSLQLPSRQMIPSKTNPFQFVHIEKSGGTTLRNHISESCEKLGLNSYIPCHNNIPCFNFHFPSSSTSIGNRSMHAPNLTVALAGHFPLGEWNSLPQCQNNLCNASCLIVIRNPLDRVISHYYQRIFLERSSPYYNISINEIQTEDLDNLLVYHRFAQHEDNEEKKVIIVDEGMSNTLCRYLLNQKTTSGIYPQSGQSIPLPSELTIEDALQAFEKGQQCIIGVLEEWEETVQMIRYWFPWIQLADSQKILNEGVKKKEKAKDLIQDHHQIIKDRNQCDLFLYELLLKQFEKQKEVLNNQIFTTNN